MPTTANDRLTARIGIDVGGTFTDLVCDLSDGQRYVLKVPSTPDDPSRAVLGAIDALSERHRIEPAEIVSVTHGTTVATNAVLERKGARVGLIATEGFTDVLEIGRQLRTQMYSVCLDPETPSFIAPAAMRIGVRERIGADAAVVQPLDEDSAIAALDRLVDAGAEAVAISLLFSFANPSHEERIRELARERYPELLLSLSSDVDPAFREYERTAVTAFDAYIKPTVSRYLTRLQQSLSARGIKAPLQVMQSRGGLAHASVAMQRPVRLFLSGPAAGVLGAQLAGNSVGVSDLISVDIGGTSCDIALVSGAKPLIRAEGLIDGFPVRVPMVDVNAIGAGGGSIAWIDAAGGLRVGPHSAGSDPGPACYGRGGEQPTVTDASLVLGLLDPGYFAGGTVALERERAHQAIERHIAEPLGMTVTHAAAGIHRVVNAQMAEGIRLVSIRQGFDPRDFTLLPLGGAGPLHACALAQELHMTQVLVPADPGVLSAAGALGAPIEHEAAAAFGEPMSQLDLTRVHDVLTTLDARARELMSAEAVADAPIEVSYFADVCYIGQGYHLEVPLELTQQQPLALAYQAFLALHDRVYGYAAQAPVKIVNLRTVHRVQGNKPTARTASMASTGALSERRIFFGDADTSSDAKVIRRDALEPGNRIAGPAIIEQADSTTWVPPAWSASVLDDASLLITVTS